MRWALLLGLWTLSCSCESSPEPAPERLSSWSPGPVKERLLEFVDAVTDPAGASYVAPSERIAVFDLDGTLIIERPRHIEVLVAMAALRNAVANDASLGEREPYRAVVADDEAYIEGHGGEIVTAAAGLGGSLEEFRDRVRDFLATEHPTLTRPYSALFYAPMVELLELLRSSGFEVYVVSQSQQEYMRAFARACLGVEPENVIGSTYAFTMDGENFVRTATPWEPYNRGEGKVLRIRERTGGLPILAFGNGTGDRYVLEAAERADAHLVLFLDHDDGKREFEYGNERMLGLAREHAWQIVSMKRDFGQMFQDDDCLR